MMLPMKHHVKKKVVHLCIPLQEWMGLSYWIYLAGLWQWWPLGHEVVVFLNKTICGEVDDSRYGRFEVRTRQLDQDKRCEDWKRADRNGFEKSHPDSQSLLLNPFGKGDDWYPEAIKCIKSDLYRLDNLEEWETFGI
jgi:hypothetical protein